MYFNFGKWFKNFESSCTLLSKVVELWQLWQLYDFAKLPKLSKVRLDVLLMYIVWLELLVRIGSPPLNLRDMHWVLSCETSFPRGFNSLVLCLST